MPIDLDAVGRVSAPHEHRYTWRDQVIYALGIGAPRTSLAHLYEGVPGGLVTFPTYGVVPALAPVMELVAEAGVQMEQVVHGAQRITVLEPLPAEATLTTTATFTAVYDLKRFVQLRLETESLHGDTPVQRGRWQIIVRERGGFGGARPPSDEAPKVPRDRPPDWTFSQRTHPEQALLYRLSGDLNPLHADPAVAAEAGFEDGPILHGLATFGFLARAAIEHEADGDAAALETLAAQFRKPVWPGDTLNIHGWRLPDGCRTALQVSVDGRDGAVVTNAWAAFRG
ncbi:MAG: MaoC/PaaZ C-terminal domain-containing protein [Myxococcota bacterium]